VVDSTPAQRRKLWVSAMHQFAAVHLVPAEEVAFVDRPERGSTGLDQQLSYWWDQATFTLGDGIPDLVLDLFEWLRANKPEEPPGLSWGDARIGNIMFGDDFEVVAVMDWEQASMGGGLHDLGWWLFFDDMHSVEVGLARLDGLGTRQETIDLWEELTGRKVSNLVWHEAFAGVKTALLAMRTRRVLNLGTVQPDDRNPYIPKVCRLLGRSLPREWQ
jgi:aminoglycoside phosphotransferase (APT) family kinase protein